MRLRTRVATVAILLFILAAGTTPTALADYQELDGYIAESYVSGGREPINVILSERVRLPWYGASTSWPRVRDAYLALRDGADDPVWFDNDNCHDFTMALGGYWTGAVASGSLSTDDSTSEDPYPWLHCGAGERNHLRGYERYDDQVYLLDRRNTVFIAASIETNLGYAVYDEDHSYLGPCDQVAVHCLTHDTFDSGRDGYHAQTWPHHRGAGQDLLDGWKRTRGYPIFYYSEQLDPAPTEWITQGLGDFRGDGFAYVIEDSWDMVAGLGAEVSASSSTADHGPRMAFDETTDMNEFDSDSRWISDDESTEHWLQVDFGEELEEDHAYDTVQVVSGLWTGPGLSDWQDTIRSARVEVSNDGSTWTTVQTVTNAPEWNPLNFSFLARTERFVRLTITDMYGGDQASVGSMQIMRLP